MSIIRYRGTPVRIIGEFVKVGDVASDFELVRSDLSLLAFHDLKEHNIVLNIFPSLDTSVCAATVRKFNEMAASMPDTIVLAISKDLPFAHARFCSVEGINHLVTLSDYRLSDFDENYGVLMADGPLKGLLARAVVVIGKDRKVKYVELVSEVTQEPNYSKVLEILR